MVREAADATAYALARLPATYAACARALAETAERLTGFAPRTLLDAGAGPGGAAWAALEAWPGLTDAVLLDSNPNFLALAQALAAGGPEVLGAARRLQGDLAQPAAWPDADLVLASYALAEIPAARRSAALEALWAACRGLLVIVEPGTPDGWRRMLAARDQLLARGGVIAAPCPHAAPCPLASVAAAPGDWCHFVQRLPRSRDHRQAKGGQAPFEDEKFCYLAAARPSLVLQPPAARVLAPPRPTKSGLGLKLCLPDGVAEWRTARKRDKARFPVLRRLDWGDAVSGEDLPAAE